MSKEYINLLAKRESKEVLGKGWVNLWLLTLVLTATYVSIAFSNGSMEYLSLKMNDPFTNWVNISKSYDSGDFDGMRRALENEEVQKHYMFDDVQSDNYTAYSFIGNNGSIHYLQGRFFNNINSKLVRAILDKDNVVANSAMPFDRLSDSAFGFIITEDVLKKLGYTEEDIPAYIDYMRYSEGADTLGVEMIAGDRAAVPMPLLGVVKRLPGNMDVISSRFFLEQDLNDISYPLDMNNLEYQSSLVYYVPENISDQQFSEAVSVAVPDSLSNDVQVVAYSEEDMNSDDNQLREMMTWKPGRFIVVYFTKDDVDVNAYQASAKNLREQFKNYDVKRIFNYNTKPFTISNSQYISINFNRLDSIRAFEQYAKDNFNMKIEMSQVNAKENFNAVSVMANILSWAMITFSLVCIILFVVNMLQSYFQKVKRNLGTFKAFGMGTFELIRIYVVIVLSIIVAAIVISLGITWLAEFVMRVCHIMKDGQYDYLSLWSMKTVWASIIVVVAALFTVYLVMKRLLQRTPGDLIYDRN